MPYKVLVVEDHDDSAAMLETFLRLHGYETLSARNGLEAYTIAHNHKPDLIVTDLSMPGMDGVRLIEMLHSELLLPPPPILLLTAYSDDRITRALEAGATAWVSKPVDAELLKETISLLLQNHPPPE